MTGTGDDAEVQDLNKRSLLHRVWATMFEGKSNAWMAVFAFVLSVFTFFQVQLAQIANDNSIATQRAFVNPPIGIPGTKMVKDGKTLGMRFEVRVENSGLTPAKDVHGAVNIQPFLPEMPSNFEFEDVVDSEPSLTIIGPRGSGSYHLNVTLDTLTGVAEKRHRLYVWGWVRYRDVFSGTPMRLTEFCNELTNVRADGPYTDPDTKLTWSVIPCAVPHNCYDEDCPDFEEHKR